MQLTRRARDAEWDKIANTLLQMTPSRHKEENDLIEREESSRNDVLKYTFYIYTFLNVKDHCGAPT